MMLLLPFIYIICLPLLSHTKYPYRQQDHIITLGDLTWELASQEHPHGLLVYFYDPSLLLCRQFWPELYKATQSLYKQASNIQIAKVNCHDEIKLCNSISVIDFPTLRLYRAHHPAYEYRESKTAEGIEAWVRKVVDLQFPIVNDAESLFARYSVAIVYNVLTYAVIATYVDYFDMIEIAEAGPELRSVVGENSAVIVTQRSKVIPIEDSMISREIKGILHGLLEVEKEAVRTITWGEYLDIQQGQDYEYVIFFKTEGYSIYDNATVAFDEVSGEYGGEKMRFLYVSVVDDLIGFQLGKLFGVSMDSGSSIGIISKHYGPIKKYKLENPQGSQEIRSFLSSYRKGSLERYYRSAAVPDKAKGYVRELVRDNFKEVTEDPNRDVIVMLYLPICRECTNMEAAWESLGYRMRYNGNIVMAKMDMNANELEGFEEIEPPVFMLYLNRSPNRVIKYSYSKTLRELKQFILEYIPELRNDLEL